MEPIQGKGVYIPADDYLPEAQRLCRKHGTLFICDEVQVGMGRTGRFLCCEHWELEPDIVTLSKSLGGGYMPVSATIMRRSIHDKMFSRLDRCQVHSTTFGENELAMAAGLATLHVMDEERLVERAAAMGQKLCCAGSPPCSERHEMIADVRGKGLMIGIEFRPPRSLALRAAWTAAETAQKGLFAQLVVMALMRDHHILTQVGGPDVNIIKLLPPLIIGDEEVEAIVAAFDAVMDRGGARPRARVGPERPAHQAGALAVSHLLSDVQVLAAEIGPRGTGTPGERPRPGSCGRNASRRWGCRWSGRSSGRLPARTPFHWPSTWWRCSPLLSTPLGRTFGRWLGAGLALSTAPLLWQAIRTSNNPLRPLLPNVTSRNVVTSIEPRGEPANTPSSWPTSIRTAAGWPGNRAWCVRWSR